MSLPDRVAIIIRQVAHEHSVDPRDILGDSRLAVVAKARRHAMIECRRMEWASGKPPSFPQVGRWFNRDHTTIIHACRDMETEEQGVLAL